MNDEQETKDKPEERRPERKNLLVPDVERWPLDADKPIIELEDVHKSFGQLEVLKGLSLKIPAGKITIIVGASGSGKTVLIKHMNGLYRPDRGAVRLFGKDVNQISDDELSRLRKRIGTMFQNYALFDSMSVLENVAFPLYESGVMKWSDCADRARELLEELDLGHAVDQNPPTLSGGMKKRVSLARALVANPELVLFDEPTTGLDPIMMERVDQMIEDITERFGLTSVLISHDIATIFRIADHVAVLHDGQIIAEGTPDEMRESDDERVQKLIGGSSKADIDAQIAAAQRVEDDPQPTVRMSGVRKAFGDNVVLKGVDFVAPRQKITVLIGGSGSGKSVMMKHLLGLMQPDAGTVKVFDRDITGLSEGELRQMRTRIGMLFQHAALFDSMSVRENVAFPLVERRVARGKEADERVNKVLEDLRLSDVADKSPLQISSGQQKRVSLARALVTEPELIIYDEPTTGQDPIMSRYVEDMIVEVQEKFDVTSIVISHDMASAVRIADSIAMLHKGEIIIQGPPKELLESTDDRVHDFIFAADVAR